MAEIVGEPNAYSLQVIIRTQRLNFKFQQCELTQNQIHKQSAFLKIQMYILHLHITVASTP